MTGVGGRPEVIIEGSNHPDGPWLVRCLLLYVTRRFSETVGHEGLSLQDSSPQGLVRGLARKMSHSHFRAITPADLSQARVTCRCLNLTSFTARATALIIRACLLATIPVYLLDQYFFLLKWQQTTKPLNLTCIYLIAPFIGIPFSLQTW